MNNFIKKGFVSLLSLSVLCPVSALTKTESVFSNLNTDGSINKTTVTNHICSKDKDDKITSLSIENNFYKNNRQLIKSEKIRHEQSKELSNKDEELKYYKNAFTKVTRALDIITKRRPMPYVHNYVSFAESVMAGKRAREMDDEAQREFDKANKKGEDIWL
ncbi:MAG: hypothetical protein J6O56_04620 [Bacilli bacterium]|nr:hypothetical protein [Bacilli bacterium]